MAKRTEIISLILAAALALIIFAGILQKAVTASFTHDEAISFNQNAGASLADIYTYKIATSNNHLLNSLLMKACAAFFGVTPVALRLPNLLALLAYMIFSLFLLRRTIPQLLLPGFILLTCNPYLLDFFALARGNGLSYACLAGSLLFLVKFAETRKTGNYIISLGFAALGTFCHFLMLYVVVSLALTGMLWPAYSWRMTPEHRPFAWKSLFSLILVDLAVFLLLGLLLYVPFARLLAADQFYYGGESGFWKDTVGSLAETFLYGARYSHAGSLAVKALVVVLALSLVITLVPAVTGKKRYPSLTPGVFLFPFLMFFMAAISALLFYLFGTKLPIRRFALIFYPVFMFSLIFLVDFLSRGTRTARISAIFLYSLALLFFLHTAKSFSLSSYLDWDYDKNTARVMQALEADVKQAPPAGRVSLGITWLFEPSVNFYRLADKLDWLQEANRDGPSRKADYYYVLRDDMLKVPLGGMKPVILFDDGKVLLLKRRVD